MQTTLPEKGNKKAGRPEKLDEDYLKNRDLLRCNDATFESWMRAMKDLRYKNKSDFYRDMISQGIYAQGQIKRLEEENKRLKDLHSQPVDGDLFWDIMWFLSQKPMFWRIEDLHSVLPEYTKEQKEKMLAAIPDDLIDYVPGRGWLIKDPYPRGEKKNNTKTKRTKNRRRSYFSRHVQTFRRSAYLSSAS